MNKHCREAQLLRLKLKTHVHKKGEAGVRFQIQGDRSPRQERR